MAASPPERRILIVDDEPNLVDAVRLYLEMEGYVVLSATSGGEALGKVRDLLPDLMILDVMMPEMDGLTACRRLRREHPRLPILMLTARHEVGDPHARRGREQTATSSDASSIAPRCTRPNAAGSRKPWSSRGGLLPNPGSAS